jgi:hypothetical protein
MEVAAQGDCLTEFSIIENLVTDADLHACAFLRPVWPIVFQIRR